MSRSFQNQDHVARQVCGVALLSALLMLGGCGGPEASGVGPLTSETETQEWRAPNCPTQDQCTTVTIKREVFADRPALNEAIQQQLRDQLQGNGESATTDNSQSLAQIAEGFIAEAEEVSGMSSAPWQLTGDAKTLGRHDNLLTVAVTSYMYSGGAHGMPVTRWLNWDLAAQSQVTLQDLIKPDAGKAFWAIAQQEHQRWLDAQNADTDFRENWPFARTEDFRLTDQGLVLLYGVYTLGPYAMGEVKLTLPREKVAPLLREQ